MNSCHSKLSAVFDLDSTLISSYNIEDYYKLGVGSKISVDRIVDKCYRLIMYDVCGNYGKGERSEMWGIFRPGAKELIRFALENCSEVHIWSAGKPRYVYALVEILTEGCEDLPSVKSIRTSEDCDMYSNGDIHKPLQKLIDEGSTDCPLSRTLVIDDRHDTFSKNPENGIKIPAFEPPPTIEGILGTQDNALYRIRDWLEAKVIGRSVDVRKLQKDNIFNSRQLYPESPPGSPPGSSAYTESSMDVNSRILQMLAEQPPSIPMEIL
jgi:hypothetical protein